MAKQASVGEILTNCRHFQRVKTMIKKCSGSRRFGVRLVSVEKTPWLQWNRKTYRPGSEVAASPADRCRPVDARRACRVMTSPEVMRDWTYGADENRKCCRHHVTFADIA